jgi:hypothetical protein
MTAATVPARPAAPVHWAVITDNRLDRLGCGTGPSGSSVTVDAEQVTCANCLAAMTAEVTEDHGPIPASVPVLDTAEDRWAYVLTQWHTHNLPTPAHITVSHTSTNCAIQIQLPKHQRELVDRWAAALGCDAAGVDGQHYDAWMADGPYGQWRRVYCLIDSEPDPGTMQPELASALDGVATMLTPDEPNPVCNKQIGVEEYCALDAGHRGACDPVLHGPVPGVPGGCVCGFGVDASTAPVLIDKKLDAHIGGGA